MSDEQNELRRVNWSEVFGFTQIFKSFRMAIHPSKMALCFAAILVVYLAGTVLDWGWNFCGISARKNEVAEYFVSPADKFDAMYDGWKDGRLEAAANLLAEEQVQAREFTSYKLTLSNRYLSAAFAKQIVAASEPATSASDILRKAGEDKSSYRTLLGKAGKELSSEVGKIEEYLSKAVDQAKADIKEDPTLKTDEEKTKAREELTRSYRAAQASITDRIRDFDRKKLEIGGQPIFETFLDFELRCVRSAIAAASYGNIVTGLKDYQAILRNKAIKPAADYDPFQPPAPTDDPPGFLFFTLLAWQGVVWLVCRHWVFAIVFGAIVLAASALFGGAVNRIAALHFAREEKISIGQALKFSAGKFLSFLTAPLIPLALVFLLGLLIALGGLLLANYAGGILFGALLLPGLILGLIIAFLLVGLVAGAPLMYPTIAVEGSDSFDAISRSFSYVFARPWRSILYGLVALIYGVFTYLFVRLFVFIALAATHAFASWGVIAGGYRLSPEAGKLDVLWNQPQFETLFGPFNWAAMSGMEKVGAFLIGIWVFVAAGLVGAYLLSYLASSTTSIYYLLRRSVDATDLDDVYVEEAEEAAAAPAETPAEAAPAATPSEPPRDATGPA